MQDGVNMRIGESDEGTIYLLICLQAVLCSGGGMAKPQLRDASTRVQTLGVH